MFWALHPWLRTYIHVTFIAFITAVLLMPVGIVMLRRLGMVDQASPGKLHKRAIPRGGGIVLFLAFAVAVLYPNYRDNPMKGVMLGAAICLVVGAVDDLRGIPAVLKLATLVGVTVIMSLYGVTLNLFKFYPLDLLLTVLWIVGVTSAFNALDNMDGLASGVAVIVSGIYLTIAVQTFRATGKENLAWFGLLAAGLIGANLGFLVYNFKPAKVFMGDSGSFFLGFTLAALGVMGEWTESRVISCTIPMLILGVPIFDFAYIIFARILKGQTRTLYQIISHCSLDHLSHRLTWIGFTERRAVLFIYLVAIAMGVTAILLRNGASLLDSALGLLQGLAIIAIVVILMAVAARGRQAADEGSPPGERDIDRTED